MNGLVAEVLAAWREAERVASQAPPGPQRDHGALAADRLRDLYRDLVNAPEPADPEELRMAMSRYRVHGPLTPQT